MTREEAMEILKGAIKKPNTKDGYLGQALDMAITALEQKPKTGHWIDRDATSAVCSCCNRNNALYGEFCKWCGSKND